MLTKISDISPLAGLNKIVRLEMSANQVATIESLAGVTSLEFVCFFHNQITDVSPLLDLPNLKVVELKNNNPDLIPGCPLGDAIEALLARGVKVQVFSDDLGEGTDAPQLDWDTSGVTEWIPTVEETHDGIDAVTPSGIAEGGGDSITTIVSGPGDLAFWWRRANVELKFIAERGRDTDLGWVGTGEGAWLDEVVWKNTTTATTWGSDEFELDEVPTAARDITAVAAGPTTTWPSKSDGHVVAWGNDEFDQVSVPEELCNIAAIAAGDGFSLAVTKEGELEGWGRNDEGQLDFPEELGVVKMVAAGGAPRHRSVGKTARSKVGAGMTRCRQARLTLSSIRWRLRRAESTVWHCWKMGKWWAGGATTRSRSTFQGA